VFERRDADRAPVLCDASRGWRTRGDIRNSYSGQGPIEVAFGIECELARGRKFGPLRSDLSIRFTCGPIPRSPRHDNLGEP